MVVAQDGSRPVWAGNGMGFRSTRITTYAIVAACLVFAVYFFVSWESIPSLDQLKSQYCETSTPPPAPAIISADDELDIAPSGPPTEELQAKIAALEKSLSDKEVAIKNLTKTLSDKEVTINNITNILSDKEVTITNITSQLQPQSPPLRQHNQACIDPYRRPGYLFTEARTGNHNTTRWIPYTTDFLEAEDPKSAAYPYNATENGDVYFDEHSRPEDALLNHPLTPTNWMEMALKESLRRKHGEPMDQTLSWMYGRVVLLISDSVDRFNSQWFCYEFSSRHHDEKAKFKDNGIHTTATCHVPSLNFTLIHWHLVGMTTYNPGWWWDPQSRKHVPFEDRYENVWNKTFKNITSVSGKGPDLIIWQSSVWDRNNWLHTADTKYGKEHWMTTSGRQLVWDEVRFYTARAKKLIRFVKEKVGQDVPMMLRTMTMDRDRQAKDLQPYDTDRLNRVIGEKFGIEPFEWGRLIAGHADLYRDNLHPAKGVASWLWATMMLEYVARAVGAGTEGGARPERAPYFNGWNECHDELVPIGSNAYH